MFANWVEVTSTTGGTGTLTVTAVSGAPSLQSVWGSSGTQWVSYVVDEWGDNTRAGPPTKSEAGVGSIVLSTNVLTRTKKLSTWNGTTYTAANPSALSFGTTADNIRIMIAPLADFGPEVIPFSAIVTPAEALGVASSHGVISNSTSAFVANRECYVPHLHLGCGGITTIGVAVTTQIASSGVKAALYAVGSDGFPGARLKDWGATPFVTTSTGAKTQAVTEFYLAPGWYYVGLISGHAPTVRAFDTRILPTPAGTSTSGQMITMLTRTAQSYATGLPDPASTAANLTANVALAAPILYLTCRNT